MQRSRNANLETLKKCEIKEVREESGERKNKGHEQKGTA
jgi:hypothetical protein